MKWQVAILTVGVLAAAGCAKNSASPAGSGAVTSHVMDSAVSGNPPRASDREAVEQAIRQHLSANTSLNLAAMNMTVERVSISGAQAQADALFSLKTGGPPMQVSYSLERHAGGWIVTKGEPSGGQFVHPPMDENHVPSAGSAGGSALPDLSGFFKTFPPTKPHPKPRR